MSDNPVRQVPTGKANNGTSVLQPDADLTGRKTSRCFTQASRHLDGKNVIGS